MAELKATEYKLDFEKITEELADLKRKYLEEKKLNRAKRTALESTVERDGQSNNASASEVRFTGGGFRMSVQQISTK